MSKTVSKFKSGNRRPIRTVHILRALIVSGLLIECGLLASWPKSQAILAAATTAQPEQFTELSFVSAQPIKQPLVPKTIQPVPYRVTNQSDTARTYHITITTQPAGAPAQVQTQTITIGAHAQKTLTAQVSAPTAKSSVALTISLSDPLQSITYNFAS